MVTADTTTDREPTPPAEALRALLAAARVMLDGIERVRDAWEHGHLPDGAYTPETGYPFTLALEDQVETVAAWVDRIEADLDIAEDRA